MPTLLLWSARGSPTLTPLGYSSVGAPVCVWGGRGHTLVHVSVSLLLTWPLPAPCTGSSWRIRWKGKRRAPPPSHAPGKVPVCCTQGVASVCLSLSIVGPGTLRPTSTTMCHHIGQWCWAHLLGDGLWVKGLAQGRRAWQGAQTETYRNHTGWSATTTPQVKASHGRWSVLGLQLAWQRAIFTVTEPIVFYIYSLPISQASPAAPCFPPTEMVR